MTFNFANMPYTSSDVTVEFKYTGDIGGGSSNEELDIFTTRNTCSGTTFLGEVGLGAVPGTCADDDSDCTNCRTDTTTVTLGQDTFNSLIDDNGEVEFQMILGSGINSSCTTNQGTVSFSVTPTCQAVEQISCAPSDVPSDQPSSLPSSEPSWSDDVQCKKKDPEDDICAELNGRCKVDCEDDENFVCVPGLCSYDRNWDKPTKSPKMRQLKEDEEVVDFDITAEGGVERKLKAIKAPSEKGTKTTKAPKATKAPKSSCACRVPRARGCKK